MWWWSKNTWRHYEGLLSWERSTVKYFLKWRWPLQKLKKKGLVLIPIYAGRQTYNPNPTIPETPQLGSLGPQGEPISGVSVAHAMLCVVWLYSYLLKKAWIRSSQDGVTPVSIRGQALWRRCPALLHSRDPTMASTRDTESEWKKQMEELAIEPEDGGSQPHG